MIKESVFLAYLDWEEIVQFLANSTLLFLLLPQSKVQTDYSQACQSLFACVSNHGSLIKINCV